MSNYRISWSAAAAHAETILPGEPQCDICGDTAPLTRYESGSMLCDECFAEALNDEASDAYTRRAEAGWGE